MAVNSIYCVLLCFVMVVIASHNCNGLRNVVNLKNYLAYLEEKKYGIAVLQETFWTDTFVDSIRHLYNGTILCSNNNTNRQGVAILVSNYNKDRVKFIHKDDNGRLLHVTYEEDDIVFNILSVYAPNDVGDRAQFFEHIDEYCNELQNIIIGGDFNTSLSSLDRGSKKGHSEDGAYRNLVKFINDKHLYDVWRTRNKSVQQFSFQRVCNGELQQSRIDYFIVSKSLSVNIQNVYYNNTSLSDHNIVVISLNVNNIERGPGLWVFNNTLLYDDVYAENVIRMIDENKECPLYVTDILLWWDNLKYKIKRYSQVYGSRKAKEKRKEFYFLQNKLNKLSQNYADGKNIDVTAFENLKLELSEYESSICNGAILRSKAKWAVDGDCNSKYFLNLEKFRQESNCVKELLCDDDRVVSDTDTILEEEYKFYSKLYSCVEVDVDKMNELLDYNDKTVDDHDVEICDDIVNEDEIRKALWEMSANKSPGSDGLTVEFYRHFFNYLRDILLKVYINVHEKQTLSRSMKIGILSLIYKKKGDKKMLKNYRPISLLQVDYKIIARVMANRFKKILPSLVSENQSCCIMGKDIADTICNIRDIIDVVERDNLEGYLLKFDQEKAFDRVSHEYLLATLEKFGFGNSFINWIRIFYSDICSSVKCNGFLTKYFDVKNGIRQGCPISALLYVLAAESLQSAIRKNYNIKGIAIPNSDKIGLAFQHADDTTLTVGDHTSIWEAFNVFELYSEGTGAKINKEKSEIMCIGSGVLSDNDVKAIGIKQCYNVVQILGVYIGSDYNECLKLNWNNKVSKIINILNMWLQRKLTIQGRCTVINSLLMSRLWYTLSVFSMPETIMNEIKQMCVKFLWGNGAHLLQYNTVVGKKTEGGLKFDDIFLKLLSFRLKFLSRFLDEDNHVLWKETCRYFLQRVYDMNLDIELFFMELSQKDLKCIPPFYQEMFQSWQYVKDHCNNDLCIDMIYRQPLFLNPEIKIRNKLLLWKHFVNAGICCIKDIAFEVKTGFLPSNYVIDMIQAVDSDMHVHVIRKQYKELLSAIPMSWKNTVNQYVNVKCKENCSEFTICIRDKVMMITLCRAKMFYQLLCSKCFHKPNCIPFWEEKFGDDINFASVWQNVNFKWKTPDLIELDYKIVHNRVFTFEKLCKIGITDNSLCIVCKSETEDLVHMLLNCSMLKGLHFYVKQLVERLFANCNSNRMSTVEYDQLVCLGLSFSIKDVNVYFLNFMFSIIRYCIFKRRNLLSMKNEKIDLIRFFKYTLKHYVSYFHTYCCKIKRNRNVFEKYFLLCNPIVAETEDILIFNL